MEIRVIPLTGELVKQEVQHTLLRQQLDLKEEAILTLYDSLAQVSPANTRPNGDAYIPSSHSSTTPATYSP